MRDFSPWCPDMETNADKGLPLFEAIRTYSDPTDWAEFENLLSVKVDPREKDKWSPDDWKRHDFRIQLSLGLAFPGSGAPAPPKNLQAWHHWVRLRTAFHKRFQSGEIVATGYVKPANIADNRRVIPADKWGILKPDFRNSTASGGGMEIIHVIVHPPGSEVLAISGELAVAEQAATNRSPLTHSGMVGRPTAKHLYPDELERRAKAGIMCGKLAAESRELHNWLQQSHPEINPGTPKTIENNIRDRYRQLKAQRPQNKPPK